MNATGTVNRTLYGEFWNEVKRYSQVPSILKSCQLTALSKEIIINSDSFLFPQHLLWVSPRLLKFYQGQISFLLFLALPIRPWSNNNRRWRIRSNPQPDFAFALSKYATWRFSNNRDSTFSITARLHRQALGFPCLLNSRHSSKRLKDSWKKFSAHHRRPSLTITIILSKIMHPLYRRDLPGPSPLPSHPIISSD